MIFGLIKLVQKFKKIVVKIECSKQKEKQNLKLKLQRQRLCVTSKHVKQTKIV